MQTESDIPARLAAARAEQPRLDSEVERLDQEVALAEARASQSTKRQEFDAAKRDADWQRHQKSLADAAAKEHRSKVLARVEAEQTEALRATETQAVLDKRADAEQAFSLARDHMIATVESLGAALSALDSFDRTRQRNPRAAVSTATLKIDALMSSLNAPLQRLSRDSHICFINTGDPGLIELRVVLPARIPQVLR